MDNAFAKSNEEVLSTLGVNPTTGLTDEQVSTLQAKHGKNAIAEEPPTPLWELILEQFKDQLVIILLADALGADRH